MSHSFRVSDEAYETLASVAAAHGRTPEDLFRTWVNEMREQTFAQSSTPTVEENSDAVNGYDPAHDPLAPFLGAFEATTPDVVRRHDDYLSETYADTHDSGH